MLDTRAYLRQRDQKPLIQSQDENMIEAPSKLKSVASHSLKNLPASTNPAMTLRSAFGDLGNKIANNQPQKALKSAIPVKKEKVENLGLVKKEKVEPECIKMDIDDDVYMRPCHVIDIDENDADNQLLLADYVKDVYVYLMSLEKKLRISPGFLEGKLVTAKMRSVLIDWLIQVHLKFHLLQETLYLCVQIIDAYLQVEDVSKMQLQLVGVTAMFLASKYEEMYVPTIEDFVYMTDNTYTKSEIRRMEIKILQGLNFMFGRPLPLAFLRRFSKAGPADPKQHTLSKYFMELSLHDSEFTSIDPSYLAASSLCLSFKLLNGPQWNDTMNFYSTYSYESLQAGMKKIAKLVLKSIEPEYKYKAVNNKYSSSKYLRISLLSELQGSVMKQVASMDV